MLKSWVCFIIFVLASFAGMSLCPEISFPRNQEDYITHETRLLFFPLNNGLDLIHSEETSHPRANWKRNPFSKIQSWHMNHADRMFPDDQIHFVRGGIDVAFACRIYHGNTLSHSPRNRAGPAFA